MEKRYKKKMSLILICLLLIFLLCFSSLTNNSKIFAQNPEVDIQSINKYFNRDLPDTLFIKLKKLGDELLKQKTAAPPATEIDKDIWVIPADGKDDPYPLTIDDKWDDEMPVWSPDDQQIAYVSTRSGYKKIWKMNSDGTGKTQITKGTDRDSYPLWSPDERQIAFIRDASLFLIDLKIGKEEQMTLGVQVERVCSWSRDGKSILLVIRETEDQVKLADIDLSMKRLTDLKIQSDLHSLWSNLHLCPQKDCAVFDFFEIDNYDIKIENLLDEKQMKLTADPSHDRHPKWSNKGDLIVFSSNRKTPEPRDIKW